MISSSASPARAVARVRIFTSLALACVTGLSCVLFSGCSSTSGRLTPQETAKRVKILREEADRCLTEFTRNADNPEVGANIDDLLCYVEKQRETTELFPSPSDCPSCFARYGEGLRMLGEYYRTLSLKQQKEIERLGEGSSRAQELRKLADANEDQARANYRDALTNFNMHLRSPGPIDDRVYWKGFECAARLDRYKVALEYLDRYERNSTNLPQEELERVEKYRAWAQDQYDRLVRDTIRQELGSQ